MMKVLIKHIKSVHFEAQFKCGEENCYRISNNAVLFHKHLKSKHAQPIPTQNIAIGQQSIVMHQTETVEEPEEPQLPHQTPETVNDNFSAEAELNDVENFLENSLKFALTLHGFPVMTRKQVALVMDKTFKMILDPLCNIVLKNTSAGDHSNMSKIIKRLKEQFKMVDNEKKLIKILKEKDLYIEPEVVTIDYSNQLKLKNGLPCIMPVKISCIKSSISEQFRKIFEQPGVFKELTEYVTRLNEKDYVTSYIQSEAWKKKVRDLNKDSHVFPYFLYFDGMSPDNALGSHRKSHSLEDGFIKLPFLPPELDSLLEKILVVYNYKTVDKKYGNLLVLAPLIEEVKELEANGITIQVEGESITIYFVLGLVLGDNLGLNEILGFVKCFTANHPCRMCRIHRDVLRVSSVADENLRRNEQNYMEDVATHNVTDTGIHEACVFNDISSFNVWEDAAVDIMHDFNEGICHNDLAIVIGYYLEKGLITLEKLNYQKQTYSYGYQDAGNTSVPITLNNIKDRKFQMSSSEMRCFYKYLPLMIGDYEIYFLLNKINIFFFR
jgi:hypothetical protein